MIRDYLTHYLPRDIDIPPLWLAMAIVLTWALSFLWSVSLFGIVPGLGEVLVFFGLCLLAVSVAQMALARTTFIPRRNPKALVTRGVFKYSRNPIYLADAMILTGAVLYWGAVFALPVIPGFMWLITQRYIADEENRLKAGFGAEYSTWAAKTPRWIGPI